MIILLSLIVQSLQVYALKLVNPDIVSIDIILYRTIKW